ncbi:alpha/beta hydrolase [Sinomicrobium weinanense]|uniref:Esterase n=1 Tax=Sinomicrobium weinanense TaxID=2842200 RepID=A0A926JNJ1_9FLAO|nr:alpha/beta hydrolase-fold protein [Sinomicrobium weinanense]MBC9794563.1 esterase [Sinomicrobium weinanense]MBU3124048.1 esterase [Sinomicrobium weinanense]
MKSLCYILLGFLTVTTMYPQTRSVPFDSEHLEETRNIQLYVPENYSEDHPHPLILVLDADRLFDLVVANTKFYAANGQMPESIIVGIDQKGKASQDCSYDAQSGFPAGKGAGFFEFIGMELLPSISEKYNLANFKMIIGHLFTGNFINYYLFKDDPLFDAYIDIHPDFAPNIEKLLQKRLSGINSVKFYYLAAGEDGDKKQVERIQDLNTSLKTINNDKLFYFFDSFENTDDFSAASCAIPKALNQIFSIYRPITPNEYKNNILTSEAPVFEYLEKKYQRAEELFGFHKQVSLNDMMAIYAGCLKKEDYSSLEQLSKLAKKEFPGTMMGYFFEAEYLEKTGDPKKATRTYKKAFGMEEIDFIHKDLIMERIEALNY